MSKLEDLRTHASVRGIIPDVVVTVVSVQWFGGDALELTYKDPAGRVGQVLLYRDDEPRIELVEQGRPWSFDGDGAVFRLVSEAHRIRLGYDIENRDPRTGRLRFIEVKGRVAGADTITVTKNEILTSLNKPDDYILAVVEFLGGDQHRVHYVRRSFRREPDFGAQA